MVVVETYRGGIKDHEHYLDLIRSLIVLIVFVAMVEIHTRFKLLCTSYVH